MAVAKRKVVVVCRKCGYSQELSSFSSCTGFICRRCDALNNI